MTANGLSPADSRNAWVRYLDREHTARDTYLTAVDHAHWQYLNGPWPDRDAYTNVERHAWTVYYAAGRAAWQQYTADMTAVPVPPPPPTSDSDHYRPGAYLPDEDSPARSVASHAPESVSGSTWPVSPQDQPQPAFHRYPGHEPLFPFSQRQETRRTPDQHPESE